MSSRANSPFWCKIRCWRGVPRRGAAFQIYHNFRRLRWREAQRVNRNSEIFGLPLGRFRQCLFFSRRAASSGSAELGPRAETLRPLPKKKRTARRLRGPGASVLRLDERQPNPEPRTNLADLCDLYKVSAWFGTKTSKFRIDVSPLLRLILQPSCLTRGEMHMTLTKLTKEVLDFLVNFVNKARLLSQL